MQKGIRETECMYNDRADLGELPLLIGPKSCEQDGVAKIHGPFPEDVKRVSNPLSRKQSGLLNVYFTHRIRAVVWRI